VLYPTVLPKEGREDEIRPAISISLAKKKDSSKEIS